jgi:hypothetical protein
VEITVVICRSVSAQREDEINMSGMTALLSTESRISPYPAETVHTRTRARKHEEAYSVPEVSRLWCANR